MRADVAAFARQLDDVMRRQLPFAVARALTETAKKAADAERDEMRRSLDRPTPFTLRAIAVRPATKANQTAVVYIQPLQAAYLAPVIRGGQQALGDKRAILSPKNVRLDAYGNIPRGLLARLRARPDILIGVVTFADGRRIDGVWQLPPGETRGGGRTGRGITGGRRKGWKLLIRFADPVKISARYRFGAASTATARREFPSELRAAMAQAVATAR